VPLPRPPLPPPTASPGAQHTLQTLRLIVSGISSDLIFCWLRHPTVATKTRKNKAKPQVRQVTHRQPSRLSRRNTPFLQERFYTCGRPPTLPPLSDLSRPRPPLRHSPDPGVSTAQEKPLLSREHTRKRAAAYPAIGQWAALRSTCPNSREEAGVPPPSPRRAALVSDYVPDQSG
jgi:hypothetical protein